MKIEFIPLALKKLKTRRIPTEWVEETLTAPDQIVKGYMNRKVFQKIYVVRGRKTLLRAVTEEADNTWVIITAYFTSQISRYWRNEK